jgi:hypothetical protein
MKKPKDRVHPVEYANECAWAIFWRGREIPMYWPSRRQAEQHLWMLQHPAIAKRMLEAHAAESSRSLYSRFSHLQQTAKRMEKEPV